MITKFDEIQQIIEQINPVKYSSDRNFIDGSVSKLSPYISRGFISTKYIYNILISKGFQFNQIEKFTQEMIWREFWQKWQTHDIDKDIKHKQENVFRYGIPEVVLKNQNKDNR